MKRRLIFHIGFWFVYAFSYALLNTGFAAPSDLEYGLLFRFARFFVAQLILLPIKITVAYLFIYYLVPRFLLKRQYFQLFLFGLIILLIAILLSRITFYYIVFPLLYKEYPSYVFLAPKRLLYALLDILPPIAIVATIKLLRSKLESQLREQILEKEKLQSELNFLRAQTNPHFLFNTLNNIYALARKKSDQTAPVVMQLSKMLRFMLYECKQNQIPLTKEISIIEDYLELEKLRYNERLKISFVKKLDNQNVEIAPLLLLPFIENAFKHGSSNMRFNTQINILLSLENGQLLLNVKNAKDIDTPKNTGGIGLKNVQRQLDLIYPQKHELEVIEQSNSYEVILKIDISTL